MKVICYGDSNTYGFDPRSYFGSRYDAEFRWVDILAEWSGWAVINNGENGREIPQKEIKISGSVDLLIVMLGSNDLLQGNSAERIAENMEAFLRGLSLSSNKILLIAPPPLQLGAWVTEQTLIENSLRLPQMYQMLAKRLGVYFADAGQWNVQLAFDGIHFTEMGHRAFAEGLCSFLRDCTYC